MINRRSFLQSLGLVAVPAIVPASTKFIFDMGKNPRFFKNERLVLGCGMTIETLELIKSRIMAAEIALAMNMSGEPYGAMTKARDDYLTKGTGIVYLSGA